MLYVKNGVSLLISSIPRHISNMTKKSTHVSRQYEHPQFNTIPYGDLPQIQVSNRLFVYPIQVQANLHTIQISFHSHFLLFYKISSRKKVNYIRERKKKKEESQPIFIQSSKIERCWLNRINSRPSFQPPPGCGRMIRWLGACVYMEKEIYPAFWMWGRLSPAKTNSSHP